MSGSRKGSPPPSTKSSQAMAVEIQLAYMRSKIGNPDTAVKIESLVHGDEKFREAFLSLAELYWNAGYKAGHQLGYETAVAQADKLATVTKPTGQIAPKLVSPDKPGPVEQQLAAMQQVPGEAVIAEQARVDLAPPALEVVIMAPPPVKEAKPVPAAKVRPLPQEGTNRRRILDQVIKQPATGPKIGEWCKAQGIPNHNAQLGSLVSEGYAVKSPEGVYSYTPSPA